MKSFFLIALAAAMLSVLAVLALGLIAMVRGGDFNARYGNRLMWWRVRLQFVAVILFVLAILAGND